MCGGETTYINPMQRIGTAGVASVSAVVPISAVVPTVGTSAMIKPLDGPANWPDLKGCEFSRVESITLQPGMYFDRFGHPSGYFIGIPRTQPTKKGFKRSEQFIPATFVERSLRSLTETKLPFNISKYLRKLKLPIKIKLPDDIIIDDFREEIYSLIYNNENDPTNTLYSIYKVINEIVVKRPCKAAGAFSYTGDALQAETGDSETDKALSLQEGRKVDNSIQGLLDRGAIIKLSSDEIYALMGDYFPPYSTKRIPDAAFEPHDPRLINVVKAIYPYPKDGNRAAQRAALGLAPDSVAIASTSHVPLVPIPTVFANRKRLPPFVSPSRTSAATSSSPTAIPFPSLTSPSRTSP